MQRPASRGRFLAKVRFLLEQFALRGMKARLLIAALIVLMVSVIAGFLAAVLDDSFAGPVDAAWWAFLRLTDPGYLGDDEGVARATISTVLTVLGFVLFVGLLIAILTQWLNQTIQRLESGVTPVALTDHVIILGWTYQTVPIVDTLLRTRGRLKRFLVSRHAHDLRIVIMTDRVDAARREELRDMLGPVWDARRVLLRTGSPLHVDHLERVAFRDAAVVILPGAGFAERNPERVDAMTVKTLASISRFASESGAPPPLAVAELFDTRRVDVANQSYDGPSEAIAADGMISRLIAQSVRHRGLWSIMDELFMVNEGNAIYVNPVEGQAGATFQSLSGRFPKAIMLGFVRPGERRPVLNPDPETVLEAGDLPVFLARAYEDCETGPAGQILPACEFTAEELRPPSSGPRRVLVLGWSRKVPALLRELGRFGGDAFEIDIVSRTSVAAREAGLSRERDLSRGANVKQIEAGFSTPGVIEGLEPGNYDAIVVLASEFLEEKEHADAVSVVAALTLRSLFSDEAQTPHVLVELLDEENQYLFQGGSEDVIVSPMVVSYLVSQVALRRELAPVFWELTRPSGAQMVLRQADRYIAASGPVRFQDVQYVAARRGEIALGYRRASEPKTGLALNPDREMEWTVESGDDVVVLTTFEEPENAGTAVG